MFQSLPRLQSFVPTPAVSFSVTTFVSATWPSVQNHHAFGYGRRFPQSVDEPSWGTICPLRLQGWVWGTVFCPLHVMCFSRGLLRLQQLVETGTPAGSPLVSPPFHGGLLGRHLGRGPRPRPSPPPFRSFVSGMVVFSLQCARYKGYHLGHRYKDKDQNIQGVDFTNNM